MAWYNAFLLRIWYGSGKDTEDGQWAIRLEHLPDGQSLRFGDPEALLAYLRVVVPQDALSPPQPVPDQPPAPPVPDQPPAPSQDKGTS